MKEKYLYTAEWDNNTKDGSRYPTRIEFALETRYPADAIKIILASAIAHEQTGSFSNFRGPHGKVYCD